MKFTKTVGQKTFLVTFVLFVLDNIEPRKIWALNLMITSVCRWIWNFAFAAALLCLFSALRTIHYPVLCLCSRSQSHTNIHLKVLIQKSVSTSVVLCLFKMQFFQRSLITFSFSLYQGNSMIRDTLRNIPDSECHSLVDMFWVAGHQHIL